MNHPFSSSSWARDIGLLVIRVGIGAIFVVFGYGKVMGGPVGWAGLGAAMANFGIAFYPTFWGACAAYSELVGGIALIFGFATRIAGFFLSSVMFVAVVMHVSKGDPFKSYAFALSMLIVCLGLMIAGGGRWALERKWF